MNNKEAFQSKANRPLSTQSIGEGAPVWWIPSKQVWTCPGMGPCVVGCPCGQGWGPIGWGMIVWWVLHVFGGRSHGGCNLLMASWVLVRWGPLWIDCALSIDYWSLFVCMTDAIHFKTCIDRNGQTNTTCLSPSIFQNLAIPQLIICFTFSISAVSCTKMILHLC